MKVFIPMSDNLLNAEAAMCGTLVPFAADFLLTDVTIETERRPANWVPESDLSSAKARLSAAACSIQ